MSLQFENDDHDALEAGFSMLKAQLMMTHGAAAPVFRLQTPATQDNILWGIYALVDEMEGRFYSLTQQQKQAKS